MRGINRTREVLRNDNGGIREAKLTDFTAQKVLDVTEKYLGSKVEEAFEQFFSKNVAFSVQLDNPKVIYFEGYQENKNVIHFSSLEGGSAQSQIDTDLWNDEYEYGINMTIVIIIFNFCTENVW